MSNQNLNASNKPYLWLWHLTTSPTQQNQFRGWKEHHGYDSQYIKIQTHKFIEEKKKPKTMKWGWFWSSAIDLVWHRILKILVIITISKTFEFGRCIKIKVPLMLAQTIRPLKCLIDLIGSTLLMEHSIIHPSI